MKPSGAVSRPAGSSVGRELLIFVSLIVVIGVVMVSVLDIGPKVSGVHTRPRRWIFKDEKSLQHAFLLAGGGSKAVGPT
jgi:hypothetical protein